MRKIIFTNDQTNNIIHLYINKKISCKEIGKIIGCSKQVINALLQENKIELRDSSHCQQKYDIDETAFSKIDTKEKAYWLGMMAGDGWVHNEDNSFGLSLQADDKDHISKFKNFLKSNHPIAIKNNGLKNDGTFSISYELRLSNKCIIQNLRSNGIMQNKTTELKFPIIDEQFHSSFILGMIDADGWVKINQDKLHIGLGSTLDFTTECQNILIKNCELNKTKLWQSSQTNFLYCMYYGGNKQTLRIVKYLYTDCPIWLPRKKNKAITYLNKVYPNDLWLQNQIKTLTI